ncbi:sulfurtransferase [Nocardioides sp. LHG3406-4]|uniref:sulfurtransferase n=1 Tax=Nocardioides sp. LHG3406-4 TaxID=2804575 RepID=UPI003CEF4FF9
MSRDTALVTADWLEPRLGQSGLVVIEVDEDADAYGVNHIPGAIALHWRDDLQHPGSRDVIDRAGFEQLLGAKGVARDDTVVLYGGNNNWFAAYAYWYFKLYGHRDVRLLDGGRKLWELEGRTLVSDQVTRPESAYVAQDADPALRAYRDDVLAALGTEVTIIDVRSPQEFSGEILAPAHMTQEQPQRRGRVPGAVNVPWSTSANDDGTFKSDDELRALYQRAGAALDGGETIVYCRIGERSAHTWFVLSELLDQPSVRNYDGSWVEYGSLIGAPIEL